MTEKKTSNQNEKERAGSSYIIEFYTTVQLMTHEHANYVNTLVFLKNKYGKLFNNDIEIEQNDDLFLKERVQILRHSYIKGYLMLNSLKNILNIKENDLTELKKLYDNIRNDFIIKDQDSENFIIKMNNYLLSDILNNLIKSSQDFLNKMYDKETEE
jgi:hypothetical protein